MLPLFTFLYNFTLAVASARRRRFCLLDDSLVAFYALGFLTNDGERGEGYSPVHLTLFSGGAPSVPRSARFLQTMCFHCFLLRYRVCAAQTNGALFGPPLCLALDSVALSLPLFPWATVWASRMPWFARGGSFVVGVTFRSCVCVLGRGSIFPVARIAVWRPRGDPFV